jgi:hypothetical protein
MDRKKRAALTLRTNEAFGIRVNTQHIDPRYELVINEAFVSTDTGELRLFDIKPKREGLPLFSARWDHNANTVDIDLIREGRTEKNFQGHHTSRDAQGAYHIDIRVAEDIFFAGTVHLATELGLQLQDSLHAR